jgi:hypothetical protein
VQCTSDTQCDDKSACTADSCDLTTHKCVNKYACGSGAPLCCNGVCGACCSDGDCGGGVATQAIGKSCPVPYCSLTTHTCTSKLVACSTGTCCVTGCCGIQTQ